MSPHLGRDKIACKIKIGYLNAKLNMEIFHFHDYLPNATVRCPMVPFVVTVINKISEVRQGSIGNIADGYTTRYN